MEELYNLLSSSARINKKRRKQNTPPSAAAAAAAAAAAPLTSETASTASLDRAAVGPKRSTEDYCSSSSDSDSDSAHNVAHNRHVKRAGKRNKTRHDAAKQLQIHREEIAAFRNRMKIKLGQHCRADCPDPISSFAEIRIPAWWKKHVPPSPPSDSSSSDFDMLRRTLLANIEHGKWTEPTPVQMQCIPALVRRRDVMGAAPTGSGKSGAFIIPALFVASAPPSVFYGVDTVEGQEEEKTKKEEESGGKVKKGRKGKKYKGEEARKKKKQEESGSREGEIRTLLLAPSRELASQLHREVERLGKGKKGGLRSTLLSKSNASLLIDGKMGGKRGLDVLVATPLRLCSCLKEAREGRGRLDLSAVRLIVLDEADRLLDASDGGTSAPSVVDHHDDNDGEAGSGDSSSDVGDQADRKRSSKKHSRGKKKTGQARQHQRQSGSAHAKTFVEQVDDILSACPPTAVRSLFSATMGPNVRSLAESILRNPVDVAITTTMGANPDIEQKLVFVGREEGKLLAIRQLIQKGIKPPVIVFLQSKERAQALFGELMYDGVNVDVIHAGRSQAARDASVAKFRRGDTWILICTDLVARGVDFKAVNMVINYDLPNSGVSYVHRIGRTGRAGRKGEAVTLFTESDFASLRTIANVMKLSGCHVPDWMLTLKKMEGKAKKKMEKSNPKRTRIDTTPSYDKAKRTKRVRSIESSKKKR